MKILYLFLSSSLIFLFSCSGPLDKIYNESSSKEDLTEIGETIDSNDAKYLVVGMMKYTFGNSFPDGITYREIIEEGREIAIKNEEEERKQAVLAEQMRKEEESRIAKLREILTIAVVEKGYLEQDYNDYIQLKFAFQNNSEKEIRAFKGMIEFTDLFDVLIRSNSITYDTPIPPNSRVTWDASIEFNQFSDEDVLFRNKDLEDVKLVWKPEKFMFSDGSSLE
jgi:hypothetical protein